jgi:hypothetical protein
VDDDDMKLLSCTRAARSEGPQHVIQL